MISVWIFVIVTVGLIVTGVLLLLRGKEKNCAVCGYPLRDNWEFCPKCGQNVIESGEGQAVVKPEKSKLLEICTMLIGGPLLCYFIVGIIIIPEAIHQQLGGWEVYGRQAETVKSGYLQDWFDDCDAREDNVDCYILRQDMALPESDSAEKRCSYVIYINSGQKLEYKTTKQKADKENIYMVRTDDSGSNIIMGVTDYRGKYQPQIYIDNERADMEIEVIENQEVDLESILEKES